jgi:hypothetical protein
MRTVFSSVPGGVGFGLASIGAYAHDWPLLTFGVVLMVIGAVLLWRCEE